jgi:hypothetical protein
MPTAVIHELADAIAAELEDGSYSLECDFAVHDAPELAIESLTDADDVRCWLIPQGWTEEVAARHLGMMGDFGLWLVVAKKLAKDDDEGRATGDDQTEIRALTYLVQELREALRGRRLTYNADGDTALWRRAGAQDGGNRPWPYVAKASLAEKGLFLSATYLVYAV